MIPIISWRPKLLETWSCCFFFSGEIERQLGAVGSMKLDRKVYVFYLNDFHDNGNLTRLDDYRQYVSWG